MFNLRQKGIKLTQLCKFTNQTIRDMGDITCRRDVMDLIRQVKEKEYELDKIQDRNQKERFRTIRKQEKRDLRKFEIKNRNIDNEIEHLMMYFESDLRKNMVDLEEIVSRVKRNEKIIKKRELRQISADAAQYGLVRPKSKSLRRANGARSMRFIQQKPDINILTNMK